MNKLKLLIVDDNEDNRIVLRAICRKLENFDIQDAADGLIALDITRSWHPHIILMDIMMPNMDGFEASKIIKEQYPETVIIVVTAVVDARMQDNMSALGIDMYINKPIEGGLIRYKLEALGASLTLKYGASKNLSAKVALNPFNSDIRSFKTFFDIKDTEAMMDFGIWFFDHFNGKLTAVPSQFYNVLDIFYRLMTQGNTNGETMSIIIEESYEEFYITIKFDNAVVIDRQLSNMLRDTRAEFIIKENIVCAKLIKPIEIKNSAKEIQKLTKNSYIKINTKTETIKQESQEQEIVREIRVVDVQEREMLHQSFTNKTTASDYVSEIGGDILDEILELSSIHEEWESALVLIEKNPKEENFLFFTNTVLNNYISAINNLFEFTALAYALTSLNIFIKDNMKEIKDDSKKTKTLTMLLEHLGKDLSSWREHIFVLQDTADIHYLDSSFFSSCMQIESIINNTELGGDDENEMEFF